MADKYMSLAGGSGRWFLWGGREGRGRLGEAGFLNFSGIGLGERSRNLSFLFSSLAISESFFFEWVTSLK